MNVRRLSCAVLVLAMSVACSSNPNTPDAGGSPGQDAGATPTDGGGDGGGQDAGELDGGVNDAGEPGDGGVEDAGTEDGGALDAGPVDAGVACDGGPVRSGDGTTYDSAGSPGACSIPLTFSNYAAVSTSAFAGSAICGSCAEVTGPAGTTTVIVSDLCPGCPGAGDLDLSPDAFDAIADAGSGRVSVSWHLVPCPTVGDVELRVSGSNPYYLSITPWNHRFPIATMEVASSGSSTFNAMTRQTYNAFTYMSSTALVFPVRVRVTDVNGQVVEQVLTDASTTTWADGGQFPLFCNP